MRIELQTQDGSVRRQFLLVLREKLQFGLERLSRDDLDVRISVRDENGPRGGPDKVCKIVARLPHQAPICVSEVDENPNAAMDRAVRKVLHCVARLAERRDKKHVRHVFHRKAQAFDRRPRAAQREAEALGISKLMLLHSL